jgi:hypothetical protein
MDNEYYENGTCDDPLCCIHGVYHRSYCEKCAIENDPDPKFCKHGVYSETWCEECDEESREISI